MRRNRLAALCFFPVALTAHVLGQVPNANCSFGFVPVPTPEGIVMALELFDSGSGPRLYLAGAWNGFGPPTNLLEWNGAGFTQIAGQSAGVSSLEAGSVGGTAKLFVGFSGAPGVRAWNGSAWSALGSGLDLVAPANKFDFTRIDSLAVADLGSGPELFAAGRFDRAGGLPVADIAKWDGVNWSAVPSPGSRVRDMLAFDDGSGTRLFCATDSGLKIFNGATWSGTGLNTQSKRLCVFDAGAGPQLYASSRFGGPGVGFWDVGRWNGSAWTRTNLPYPAFDAHAPLAAYDDGSGNKLYTAVEVWSSTITRRLARFDGSSWSEVGAPPNAFSAPVRDLQAFDDGSGPALFVGGDFQNVFGQIHRFFAKYGCTGQLPSTNFCTPGPTQQGCVALTTASSDPSATLATPCSITTTGVDAQRSGLFLYGTSGQAPNAWCIGSTNQLCVGAPRQRMTLHNSGGAAGGCSGVLVQDWNAFQLANPGALGNPWTAGVAIEIQAWFRDPSACRGSSLTQGVRVHVQP